MSVVRESVQNIIQTKLTQAFAPLHLQVENESHRHSVPVNSETHFKVVLVSPAFSGKSLVARHQSVYGLLRPELSAGVHALALHLYTQEEWQGKQETAPDSPNCRGGSRIA